MEHIMMKTATLLAVSLLVSLAACGRERGRIGDAPRTESPSSVAGWNEVSTSGIALRFPSDWKMIDLARETFEQGADKVFGDDPRFAAMRSQASAIAEQGMIKLLAFETSTVGSGFGTNCNVVITDTPGQVTLEQIAEATVQQISPMVAAGTQPRLEYHPLNSGNVAVIRSEIKPPNPTVPALVSFAFLNLKGSRLAAVTFTAPVTDETHIRMIADQVMGTFRFTD